MIKKLLELGFEKKRLPGLKCNTLVYDLERGADRFPSYLVYFKENQDFGLFTRKSGIRELKESNLMKNIGKCSTNTINDYLEIKKKIIESGIEFKNYNE